MFTWMKRNQNQRELTERTYFIVIVIAQNKNFEIIVTIDIINRLSNKEKVTVSSRNETAHP